MIPRWCEILIELRREVEKNPNSRERSLAITKIDEFEMWMGRLPNVAVEPLRMPNNI